MATRTRRLGLWRHTISDKFRTAQWAENWNTLDAAPGLLICTSGTRPSTWSTDHAGRSIIETDTGLTWRWDGAQFVRTAPKGLLAAAQITADISTTSTSLQNAVTTAVTVPAGGRSLLLVASGPGVYSTVGLTRLALYRGATELQSWLSHGKLTGTATEQPHQVQASFVDEAPAAGAQTYYLKYSAEVGYGGTSTLQASAARPLRLSVVEV